MNVPLDALRAALAGEGDEDAFLPACRAEALGAEVFGAAAAAALLARVASPLSREPHVVEGERSLAIFDADPNGREQAVVADVYDGQIGRVWRVGEGAADASIEPALAVAFDPFLSQLRAGAAPDPATAAELGTAAASALAAVVARLELALATPRARVLILRALASEGRGAALVVAQARGRRSRLAAAAFRHDEDGALLNLRWVADAERELPRSWRLVTDS